MSETLISKCNLDLETQLREMVVLISSERRGNSNLAESAAQALNIVLEERQQLKKENE